MRTARVGGAAVVVLLLAVVAAVTAATRPGTPGATAAALRTTSGSVVRSTLFCPDVRQIAGTLTTSVVAGTTTPGAGSVTVSAAGSAHASSTTVLGAGQTVGRDDGAPNGAVVLQASGALSGGVVAEQIARANKTGVRGWSEARCEGARADQWFVGPATMPGDAAVVVLANPADSQAVASVTVLTPTGPVAASGGSNLLLPPHSVQQLPLTQLAPGVAATAVHVQTESGLVAAAVRDVRASGTTLLGTDYVPVGEPAATLSVSGIPGTVVGATPTRQLTLGNPTDQPATVRVTATTSSGSFVPTGLDALDVPAQSVRTVDLGPALGTSAASLTVTSAAGDGAATPPVVAGVLVDAASTKHTAIHELTYLGSVAPLAGPALLPVVVTQGLGDGADSVLVLSAPQGAATVRLVSTPPRSGGKVVTYTARVAAGQTTTVSLHGLGVPDGSALTVTPDGGSGPVLAARLIEEDGALGPLLSAYQLSGGPAAQPVPAVVPLPLGG